MAHSIEFLFEVKKEYYGTMFLVNIVQSMCSDIEYCVSGGDSFLKSVLLRNKDRVLIKVEMRL